MKTTILYMVAAFSLMTGSLAAPQGQVNGTAIDGPLPSTDEPKVSATLEHGTAADFPSATIDEPKTNATDEKSTTTKSPSTTTDEPKPTTTDEDSTTTEPPSTTDKPEPSMSHEDDDFLDSMEARIDALSAVAELLKTPPPECKIQVRILKSWNEDGMRRYRYAFTSDKPGYGDIKEEGDYGKYSDISIDISRSMYVKPGRCASVNRNRQGPWWSEDENAYLLDMSEVWGVAGSSIADCMRSQAEERWEKSSGCTSNLL